MQILTNPALAYRSSQVLKAADVARQGLKASRKGTDLHLVLNVILKILEWTKKGCLFKRLPCFFRGC